MWQIQHSTEKYVFTFPENYFNIFPEEIMQAKEYRPDIDVLRAIAVLAVIFYHAHIPFFSGGYVGVSIFFVISGYLITGIIKRKLANGTFSFLEFYENRIRRILPALVVVMVFFAFLYYFLSMTEILDLQRSIRRAIFGLANFFFYANTDYFDARAETMPLLHTWSLGVEEQFYFVMPALLFYVTLKAKQPVNVIKLLWIIIGCSFLFSAVFIFYNQKFTFYMLPARAWELLLGSMLAYTNWTPASQKGKSLCILLGLGIMLASITCYKTVLFPGFWALPPCLGAVLYIAGGTDYTFSNKKNIIHLLTNNKILVFIGVISYSLYLWHWPVFVFYSTFPFYKEIPPPAAAVLIAVIFFISYLSWRFVERPVRQKPFFKNRKVVWSLALLCMTSIFFMATYMRYGKLYDNYTYTRVFFRAVPQTAAAEAKTPVDFIFIGDSHCGVMEGLFQKLAEKYRLTGIMNTQVMKNAVMQYTDRKKIQQNTEEWNKLTEDYKTYQSKNLFLFFRYSQKLDGKDRYYSQDARRPLVYLPDKNLTPLQGFTQSMRDMIEEALANGVEHIYLQSPVPEALDYIPNKADILHMLFDYTPEQINAALGEKETGYEERNKKVFEVFAKLKNDYPQIEFIDIRPCLLNTETAQYAVMDEKNLFYYDDDHLTFEGSMQFYDVYDKIFARMAEEKAR